MDDDTRDLASVAAADIESHRFDRDLTIDPISESRKREAATEISRKEVDLDAAPLLSLTARHPYAEDLGRIDVLWPGRWDTEGDYVSLKTMVYGPTPDQWDGSVVYVRFVAPHDGRYLIIGHFSGHDCADEAARTVGRDEFAHGRHGRSRHGCGNVVRKQRRQLHTDL